MQTRKIGDTEVSAIGLGCMNCSAGYGPADDETSIKLLNQALDQGYNFLDTASVYGDGHNETLIGTSLKQRRNEFFLASKCGFSDDDKGSRVPNGRPEHLLKQCDNSLKRLQTDVIDLYYLHRIDANVPIEESVGALARCVEQGKIRHIGLSEVSSETLRSAYLEYPISAVQSEYSLWSRTPEFGMLQTCEELSVCFVPFSPLGRGFLTGKAQDVSMLPENDLRCSIARPRFEPENYSHNIKQLESLKALAQRYDCSLSQLVLAWLLAQKNSAGQQTLIPIPGTKHIQYMQENFHAMDFVLDQESVDALNNLINEKVIRGDRYSENIMASIDSEKDRSQS